MKVTARATRSGSWWAIEVPEVPGVFTQAKRLDQVAATTADAIATLEGIDPSTVDVIVAATTTGDVQSALESAVAARAESKRLERQATATMASVAATLTSQGLPLRDVAVIVGVSHQRVAQLLKLGASVLPVGVEPTLGRV